MSVQTDVFIMLNPTLPRVFVTVIRGRTKSDCYTHHPIAFIHLESSPNQRSVQGAQKLDCERKEDVGRPRAGNV